MLSKDQREMLRKKKEGMPGTREFAAAKKQAVKRAQIERCYRQYVPPQIERIG